MVVIKPSKMIQISKLKAYYAKKNYSQDVNWKDLVDPSKTYLANKKRLNNFIKQDKTPPQNPVQTTKHPSLRYIDVDKKILVPQKYFGEVNIIAGKRGKGKSWLFGVLAEIGTDYNIPQYVIDPMGANKGLSILPGWKFKKIGQTDPKEFADKILKNGHNYVISTKMERDPFNEWIGLFIRQMVKKAPPGIKHVYCDEGPRYLGKKQTESQKRIVELVTQERANGWGCTIAAQDMMKLSEEVRRQRDTLVMFYLADTSITAIDEMLKEEIQNSNERKDIIEDLQKSKAGECYIMSQTLVVV